MVGRFLLVFVIKFCVFVCFLFVCLLACVRSIGHE